MVTLIGMERTTHSPGDSKMNNAERAPVVSIVMDDDMRLAVDEASAQSGFGRSEWIRRAIASALVAAGLPLEHERRS